MIWEHWPKRGNNYKLYCKVCVHIWSLSGLHFPPFALNMEICGVSLHMQSKCRKLQTRTTLNTDIFHAVNVIKIYLCTKKLSPYMSRIWVKISFQKISLHFIIDFEVVIFAFIDFPHRHLMSSILFNLCTLFDNYDFILSLGYWL